MSIDNVKKYLYQFGRDKDILEFPVSSATVSLAAEALNVIPARITKTLALKDGESCIVIAVAGDGKIDNRKFKDEFGFKAKMLTPEETLDLTGHAVGGVCPFALPENIKTYCDISLKRFESVFPACGSSNSAIKLTCDELFEYSKAIKWINICKDWE
ncbi:MAG: YbaK/EbsC family protein [Candidatus Metalachnospira sp.]|nr:YbaK/EbsC family protein [Candidatus Metalachnospira sp.]